LNKETFIVFVLIFVAQVALIVVALIGVHRKKIARDLYYDRIKGIVDTGCMDAVKLSLLIDAKDHGTILNFDKCREDMTRSIFKLVLDNEAVVEPTPK
jgi:hypothetical protein